MKGGGGEGAKISKSGEKCGGCILNVGFAGHCCGGREMIDATLKRQFRSETPGSARH